MIDAIAKGIPGQKEDEVDAKDSLCLTISDRH